MNAPAASTEGTDNIIKGKQILVVEDDLCNLELFCLTLEMQQAKAWPAENGSQAKDVLMRRRHEIDLIMLDIYMPEMDGLSFLKWARDEVGFDKPVLIVSASPFESHVDDAKEMKAHFLPKPVKIANLLTNLRDLLS